MLSHHTMPSRAAAVLLLTAAALLGGCVYNPYTGTYDSGVVAAPAYGYYPYYPAYAYGGPTVVIGGGFGGWGGWRGGGWHR